MNVKKTQKRKGNKKDGSISTQNYSTEHRKEKTYKAYRVIEVRGVIMKDRGIATGIVILVVVIVIGVGAFVAMGGLGGGDDGNGGNEGNGSNGGNGGNGGNGEWSSSVGYLWTEPVNATISSGDNVLQQIRVNSENTSLDAWAFTIEWDPSVLSLDSSFGSGGVNQINGTLAAVNLVPENGYAYLNGFSAMGIPASDNIHLCSINIIGESSGTSTLDLTVINLAKGQGENNWHGKDGEVIVE